MNDLHIVFDDTVVALYGNGDHIETDLLLSAAASCLFVAVLMLPALRPRK